MSPSSNSEVPETGSDARSTADSMISESRQFEVLINGVIDYAIYMLDTDGRIVSWNAGGERIKGYGTQEVLGRHFSMFYTEEDRNQGEPAYALAQAVTHGKYEAEGWRVRKDGTRFWASVVIDAMKENGKLIGFAKITRDITERRQAQQILENAQQALFQSQKMEAVGQLTYGLAHDFNNLLTVIINSLERIHAAEGDSAKTRRSLSAARRAADRGSLITRQLLTFSRGQVLRPHLTDINALIRNAEVLLRRVGSESIEVSFDLDPDIPDILIDGAQLEAALMNLVINARDAVSENGRIRVSTRRDNQSALITVSDDGVGMMPDVARRAAEPFFTTKDIGKGSGLGLSQVYGFVHQSGGGLEIQSEPGKGTTITLRLPLAGEMPLQTQRKPIKVLLVDDDENILEVVEDSLRELNFDVVVAHHGAEALGMVKADPAIDVVFTDIAMPGGLSGVELAHNINEVRPGIGVLLTSGYSLNWLPDIPAYCDFIPKPYLLTELSVKLERIVRRTQAERPDADPP